MSGYAHASSARFSYPKTAARRPITSKNFPDSVWRASSSPLFVKSKRGTALAGGAVAATASRGGKAARATVNIALAAPVFFTVTSSERAG